MSYEGYTQYICPTGHTYVVDAMANYAGFNEENIVCPECKALPKWYADVDVTNGEDPEYPDSLPRPMEVIGEVDVPMTDHRGNKYVRLVKLYAPKHPKDWREA